MNKFFQFILAIVLFSTIVGCAGMYSFDAPAMNGYYNTVLDFTAISSRASLLSLIDKTTAANENDLLMRGKIPLGSRNIGRAYEKTKKEARNVDISRAPDNSMKLDGIISFSSRDGKYFKFSALRNGEYKVTSKRICSVNLRGEGQIFGDRLSETGEILLICDKDVYTGKYIEQGDLVKTEE